jgi:cobalt-zinc-cadmium efflux system membrane fusion protein
MIHRINHYVQKTQTLFSALALVLLASCSPDKGSVKDEPTFIEANTIRMNNLQVKNAGITTGKMVQMEMAGVLKVNGKVEVPPQNAVSVSVPLGGYLLSTKLLAGMHVNKGETIAVMEDQQYIELQQNYLITKTRLVLLENELKRQQELNVSKASSDKTLQQIESDFRTQQIMEKALSEKLKLIGIDPAKLAINTISRSISIKSPIDGFVTKVNVNIGKYTQPSEVLFELVNPSDIHLALTIFEKDIDKLFVGQSVLAYTNNKPTIKHACEVILVGKNLSADRSAEVHCHFNNYDKTLLPGMYMNAEIELAKTQSLALPDEAIVRYHNRQYIFLSKANNEFSMVEVKTGVNTNGFTQLLVDKALDGNRFVIKGAYTLLMKLKNKTEE